MMSKAFYDAIEIIRDEIPAANVSIVIDVRADRSIKVEWTPGGTNGRGQSLVR